MEFDTNKGLTVKGDLMVEGEEGDLAIFIGFNGAGWSGIGFFLDCGHNSVLDFADISGSAGYGIDLSGTYIELLSNSLIHDNELTGISAFLLDNNVIIVNCEIYGNGEDGIFGTEMIGTVVMVGCSVYQNGRDGIRIAGVVRTQKLALIK